MFTVILSANFNVMLVSSSPYHELTLYLFAFLLLGRLHLGQWIRFVPYPVVGGFLAGTGWLIIRGSFRVMVDAPLGLGRPVGADRGHCSW